MSRRALGNKNLESDIVSAICDYLSYRRYFFWRSNNIPAFNRNGNGSITMRRLPKFTMRGLPDIIVIRQGIFVGLEVKRPDGRQSPEQILTGTLRDAFPWEDVMPKVFTSSGEVALLIQLIAIRKTVHELGVYIAVLVIGFLVAHWWSVAPLVAAISAFLGALSSYFSDRKAEKVLQKEYW